MFEFSKLSIFISQRLALHQNGAEFRQNYNVNVKSSLSTIHKVVLSRTFSIFVKSNPKGSNVYIIAALCHIKAALSYLNAALMQH